MTCVVPRLAWVAAASVVLLLPACGTAEPEAGRLSAAELPSRDEFTVVHDAIQLRCATLDCHGQVGRNLRLYGYGGLRLSTPDSPIMDPVADPTTTAEIDASYESVIGLEPEALWRVIAQKANPNELSLVRKMRGIEKHKGGQLVEVGDALDRCVVGWLTHKPDASACEQVRDESHPEFD